MTKSANFKKWFTFVVLVIGGGTIFKLSSLKDAFYVPMQEFMGLTHTQIGAALSVYGLVQTIGNFASIYISDRFSKRIMISFSLVCIGLIGIYISTFPGYGGILLAWGLLSFFGEVVYWPVLLKAIRLLGDETEQGRLFGFLEAGRGVVDTIVAFSALGIFALLGKGSLALRGSILFYSGAVILTGIISYFLVEDDKIAVADGEKINKNKLAWQGVVQAVKTPEIWVVSLTIASIYSVYCGLTYFIPFLKDIYGMPVTLIGAYGIVNQYGLKMVGGPVGGMLVDKKFKSATKFLRVALIAAAVAMFGFILLPHETMNVYVGMVCTLGFGAIIFSMRAVFFAPIDEIKVPRHISGAAMSIACIFGYSPQMFAFALYGNMLDRHPGMAGYRMVFMTMIGFAIVGVVITTILLGMIKKKKNQEIAD
ncbi:MFS transporter [Fusobacterium varium]|jgi:sugar phosphate permease|uniref:MFS transporter n=1 Tax=Fusobacterium varium ATCC 27725 TaxID=469618 RepID=A0ABM6U345_FUSVA|nr:MFS transporter [Fusobacterium varium]AVQ30737.1 MFS transporter [Fusobacterium varium ATCC 27725]EES64162.1 transporter, major facilitator family protein [Fusobacterium varium ATCC 27725]VEH40645.1 Inner membrane protein yihN [Fusobacterium varium]